NRQRRALLGAAAQDVPAHLFAAAPFDGRAERDRWPYRDARDAPSARADRQATLVGALRLYRTPSQALPGPGDCRDAAADRRRSRQHFLGPLRTARDGFVVSRRRPALGPRQGIHPRAVSRRAALYLSVAGRGP